MDRIYNQFDLDNGESRTVVLEQEALRCFRRHHDDVRSQQRNLPDHEAAILAKSIAITPALH